MQPGDFVVQTTGPLSASQIQELSDLGLRITSTLGPNQYRLRGESAADAATLKAKPYIASVAPYGAGQKIDAVLTSAVATARTLAAGAAPARVRTLIQTRREFRSRRHHRAARAARLGDREHRSPRPSGHTRRPAYGGRDAPRRAGHRAGTLKTACTTMSRVASSTWTRSRPRWASMAAARSSAWPTAASTTATTTQRYWRTCADAS